MGKTVLTPAFGGILVASLIVSLDAVALSVAIPAIAEDLKANSAQAYWTGTSFIIANLAFQPLFPALSLTWGNRPVVLAALAVFIIGTVVCSVAPTITALVAGRVVQGIGGGGILAMLYVVMAEFDISMRSKAQAINGLVWLLGLSLGPIISGGFTTNVTWRWIFWISLPLAGISALLVLLFLRGPDHTSRSSYKEVDWFGAGFLAASLVSVLIPVTWGGISYAWDSWHTLVPLIIGLAGCALWLVYEGWVPQRPVLPLSILRERTTAIALIGTFATGLGQFGLIYYLPLYYQIVKGYSPIITGVALLPETLLAGPATFAAGIIMAKTHKYKILIWISWALSALGCGLLVLLDADTTVAQWFFITFVSAIGIGAVIPALAIASQAHVDKPHLAVASMLTPFVRALGQAVGVAIGNAIVQNQIKSHLNGALSEVLRMNADDIALNLASPALISSYLDIGIVERQELLSAYSHGLQAFWWFLFAASCAAGLLSLFIREMPPMPVQADEKAIVAGTAAEAPIVEKESVMHSDFGKGNSEHDASSSTS